jgi:hypothetical protein
MTSWPRPHGGPARQVQQRRPWSGGCSHSYATASTRPWRRPVRRQECPLHPRQRCRTRRHQSCASGTLGGANGLPSDVDRTREARGERPGGFGGSAPRRLSTHPGAEQCNHATSTSGQAPGGPAGDLQLNLGSPTQELRGSAHPQKRGPRVWGPLFCGLCSAVSYSPTPWRVQYHRRWRA